MGDTFSAQVRLEERGRYFEGHFPRDPVFPGVAHLDLVVAALSDWRGVPAVLTGVTGLRFRRALRPSDTVRVLITDTGPGRARCEVRCRDELSSSAAIEHAPAADVAGHAWQSLEAPPRVAVPLPAAPLLPHAPPARCLRDVTAADDHGLDADAWVDLASPFAVAGRVPAFFGIEVAAQAAAAHEALARGTAGQASAARPGYLVRVHEARLSGPGIPVGEPLHVRVRVAGSAPPLATYDAEVISGGMTVTRATISTLSPAGGPPTAF